MSDFSDTHQAALEYAQQGLRVVPIMPGEKRPALNAWQDLATTDAEQINLWYLDKYKGHGVGIATGKASGIWVLDVDNHDSLHDLEAEYGNLPETLCAVTGSGGEHHVFSYPEDGRTIRNSASGLRPGLDVRGEGGQIVAAPTTHPNGHRYSWADFAIEVAAAPEWLLDLVCVKGSEPEPFLKLVSSSDRPGDLWAAETDWAEILEPDGWQLHHVDGTGERHWTRPGKEVRDGTSATTGYTSNDTLKVFTSSHPQLTAEESYSKLGYLAAVHHQGDFSAASKQLAAEGYRADPATSPESGEVATAAVEGDDGTHPYTLRIIKGGSFVYDIPENVAPVWGHSDQVLWAKGEPLMIAGPTGVGKSTIAAQLLAGRVGIIPEVFGMPIADDGKPVLYLSLDRPSQIRGLLGRLFAGRDARAILDERLIVWAGPLTAVINSEPGLIAAMAKYHGAGTVIVDSLKDAVTKMTDDEAGGHINRAFQMVIAEGIELLVLHHQRKASQDSGTPATTIDQIYGSALIAAGMGSVLGIAGKAGAGIVTLTHLKQPQDQVGPYQIEHDKQTGLSKIVDQFDPLEHLRTQGKAGTNSTLCAMAMGHAKPEDAEKKSAKDKLDALHKRMPELVRRSTPARGGNGGQKGITWHYVEPSIESL